jgi:hypothetical protein
MNRALTKRKIPYLPDGWSIECNNFMDIEPDNDWGIEEVGDIFTEDILHAKYNGYLIDLGFYGDYYENRTGFFRLYVIKGDFINGTLFESFISRSTNEIVIKIARYFDLIKGGFLGNVKGIEFGNNSNFPDDIHIYSAIDGISISFAEDEIIALSSTSKKIG